LALQDPLLLQYQLRAVQQDQVLPVVLAGLVDLMDIMELQAVLLLLQEVVVVLQV
jgi:hypothetical protein